MTVRPRPVVGSQFGLNIEGLESRVLLSGSAISHSSHQRHALHAMHVAHLRHQVVARAASTTALSLTAPAASAAVDPATVSPASPPAGTPNSLTFHGNAARTGFNQNETVLNQSNVASSFGQLWQSPVLDGHLYASPLYMDNVSITSGGNGGNFAGDGVVAGSGQTLGVVFAATGGGSVYAIKAFDTNGATGVSAGTILWKTHLGNSSAGIDGNAIGVLGTPIIDAQANRIYVVASITDYLSPAADPNHGKQVFEIFALSLSNGALIANWPIIVTQAQLDAVNQNNLAGNTNVAFGPATAGGADERGALNLSADGSTLYVPFASYGSSNGGWLLAVTTGVTNGAANGQTPAIVSAYSGTDQPGTAVGNGGIWGAGGPALDSAGNIFVSTGDSPGGTKQTPGSWGNSVLEFNPGQTLQLTGAYTPWNYQTQDTIDTDLGGAAPIIVNLKPGTSATTELLATGGKQGNGYLVNAGNHLNNPGATPASLTARPAVVTPNQDPSLFDPTAIRPYFTPPQAGPLNLFGPYSEQYGMVDYGRSRTTPSSFVGPDGSTYIVWTGNSKVAEGSVVPTAPGIVSTKISAVPGQNSFLSIASRNTQTMSTPGASIETANGYSNEITWVVDIGVQRDGNLSTGNYSAGAPTLYAYDALTMQPLWSSPYKDLDIGGKYNTIAVARGVTFVGTDRIQAFGLTGNTLVDDSVIGAGANQFSYVGSGWTHTPFGTSTPTMGTFQGTVSTDNQQGDFATLNFTGSRIKLYANEFSTYGSATISIDGGTPVTVSLTNTTASPNSQGEGDVQVFDSLTLSGSSHTLKILNNSASNTITVDKVEIVPVSTAAKLGVSLTEGNVSAAVNQVIPYTINYNNAGSIVNGYGNSAAGVTLTETVPQFASYSAANSTPGWTLVSGTGTGGPGTKYTYTVGALAAGDTGSSVFAVTVASSVPDTVKNLSNTVTISDTATDTAGGNRLTPINSSAAQMLTFYQQPGNSAALAALNPVTVAVQDQYGNTFTADSSSTVTLTPTTGTFANGVTSMTANVVNGIATFNNLTFDTAGKYTLVATDGSLTNTTSSAFTILVASKVVFTHAPAGGTANNPIAPAVTVAVQDQNGNVVTADNGSIVTLTLANGKTFSNGSTTATATVSAGVATFGNLIFSAPGNYVLTASDGNLATATTASFTITSAPTRIGFVAQPANTNSGEAQSAPVTVSVQDAAGNLTVNDTSAVTLTISGAGSFFDGTQPGATNTSVTVNAVNGVATFNNLVINATPGSYTLTASDGSLTGSVSNSFNVGTAPLQLIDDNNVNNTGLPQVTYIGSWSKQTGSTVLNASYATVTNSTTLNSTASVTFTGTQITLYAGEKQGRGIAAVSIDGGAEKLVDLFANDATGHAGPVYTSPLLTAGSHTIQVRVTGTSDGLAGSGTTVSIDGFVVGPATAGITWINPADISYGTPLGAPQLNATANVAGAFSYSPAAGTVLHAGANQPLTVTFTPTDTANYNTVSSTVYVNVTRATPVINWLEPAAITYGTPLSSTQLNAAAVDPTNPATSVAGTYNYTPTTGTVLTAGADRPLSVVFTPTDSVDYNPVTALDSVDVNPATPAITWANPAPINYGAPLGAAQLNATSNVPGTFSYAPAAGTILGVGANQSLTATFTPNDLTNYTTTSATVPITVNSVVAGRNLFYNNSKWDGKNTAINSADDGAIATDKQALLPGSSGAANKGAFANYTSYTKGINGLMIDVSKLPNGGANLTAADFIFRAGNTTTPGAWAAPNVSPTLLVRPGAGVGGSDRIEITFPDYDRTTGLGIAREWLQVNVIANADTGLAANDTFYFGNAVAESGNSTTNAVVDGNDEILARNNQTGAFNPATITNLYDYDRDGTVGTSDQLAARNNQTGAFNSLKLILV